MVLKRIDIRPNVSTGLATGQIFGHDEISCGGSYSSLWHVTAYSDSVSPIAGDQDYLICNGASNGCTQSSGTWDLASAQPFTGILPPPGFQAIFANPVSDQTIVQPTGTSLKIVGTLDLSSATVVGFAGGSPGSGSSIVVNLVATASTVNFNDTTPAAPSGFFNIKWQSDVQNPSNVSGYVPLTSSTTPGLIQLSGTADVQGAFNNPTVLSTHLTNPLPPAQGGTGQPNLNAAFNAMAPSPASFGYLLISTALNTWGNLAPGLTGTCLQSVTSGAGTTPAWLTCGTGSITGSGTPGKIALFSTSSALAASDLTQNTGVSITTPDAFILQVSSTANSGSNFNSPLNSFTASYWTGAGAASDVYSWQNVMSSGANPATALTLSHSGSSGTAGLSAGILPVAIGPIAVPGSCSATCMSALGGFNNPNYLDVEQTITASDAFNRYNIFAFTNVIPSANNSNNYGPMKLFVQTDAANTHSFGTLIGNTINVLHQGSGLADSKGMLITSESAGASGLLQGVEIFARAEPGATFITGIHGLWVQTGFAAGGNITVPSDKTILIKAPSFGTGTQVLNEHYGLFIEDQSASGNTSRIPVAYGIFEVNANERNLLGGLTLQGPLSVAATSSVDFSLVHVKPYLVSLASTITGSSCQQGEKAFATDATAGQNDYFCTATNTWVQQLNSGASGANQTLSNLSGTVAFNLNIAPGNAVLNTANADLGNASNPLRSVWIGAAATNNGQLIGATTAARVWTLQDATGTIPLLSVAQTWGASQTLPAVISSSSNPATTGFVRLNNTDLIAFRNGTSLTNITALSVDANDNVYVGQTNAASVRFPSVIGSLTSGLAMAIQPTANTGNGPGGSLTVSGGPGAGTGVNGDLILTVNNVGSGSTAIIQALAAVAFPITNNGSTGTQINKLASYDSSGTAVLTPHGSSAGLIGVCAKNCGISGIGLVAKMGQIAVNLDNTGIPGHAVGISTTTDGFGSDCGAQTCSTQRVGYVRSAISGTLYTVDLAVSSDPVSGGSIVVTNPSVSQTITATTAGATPVITKCGPGAITSQNCFQVQDNTGQSIFAAKQNGGIQYGSGVGGLMQLTAVVSASFPASPGYSPTSMVRLGDTDIALGWSNHANNAQINFGKDVNDIVSLTGQSLFTINPGRVGMTETTAPTGAASSDFLFASSTQHALMVNNNNLGARQLCFVPTVRGVSGTTDSITVADNCGVVNYTSASAIATAIPQSTGQLANHFCFDVNVAGGGTNTFTPATSQINGGATLAIASGKSAQICADNTGNYLAVLRITSAGSGDMIKNSANVMGASGTLDGRAMSVTAGFFLPSGAGAAPVTAAAVSYDSTNNRLVFGDGTITFGLGKWIVNSQSGTTYTILSADCSKALFFSNASSIAITVPQPSSSFPNGCRIPVKNDGAGTATFTSTSSTIDLNATASLVTSQSFELVSDGTNWRTEGRGTATGLNDPGGAGFLARTTINTTVNLTLTGTPGQINVTHGVGDGTPVWSLDTTHVALDTNALTFTNKTINAASNTISNITGVMLTNNTITSLQMAVVNNRRTCDIYIGDTSGSTLTAGQLGPQKRMCFIPYAATIVEIDVSADAGTPNIILGRNRAGATVNLVSSALATAGSGGIACSNTGGTTGIDGATTCSGTLQNTGINAGDYVEAVSGSVSTAKSFAAHITYIVN